MRPCCCGSAPPPRPRCCSVLCSHRNVPLTTRSLAAAIAHVARSNPATPQPSGSSAPELWHQLHQHDYALPASAAFAHLAASAAFAGCSIFRWDNKGSACLLHALRPQQINCAAREWIHWKHDGLPKLSGSFSCTTAKLTTAGGLSSDCRLFLTHAIGGCW